MSHVEQQAHDLTATALKAKGRFERQMTAQAAKGIAKAQATTAATLAQQQIDLYRLEAQMERLSRQRSRGGGFPWGLVLLAGGAYALYRSNPTFKAQVEGLLKRVNPGIEGNLARAGDAAQDAVQGNDPRESLSEVGGELRRAGEKAADRAQVKLGDLKDQAESGAQDVKRDAQRTADHVRDDLKRP